MVLISRCHTLTLSLAAQEVEPRLKTAESPIFAALAAQVIKVWDCTVELCFFCCHWVVEPRELGQSRRGCGVDRSVVARTLLLGDLPDDDSPFYRAIYAMLTWAMSPRAC